MKKQKDELFKKQGHDILQAVGGTENVESITHCATRLRFNLKNMNVPNDQEIKKLDGVIGVTRSGGQYQIIIGQTVNEMYYAIVKNNTLMQNEPIKVDLHDGEEKKTKEKFSFRKLGSIILNKLAGSLTPIIPVLVAAGFFKMIVALVGPSMFNILSVKSDIYRLFTFAGDAGFYFLPIIIGYTAAKQFKTSPILSMFMGAIMLDPNLLNIVNAKQRFTVFGIPMHLVNYSSTIIPIILTVWIMSYVEPFLSNHLPTYLRTILAPTFTIIIMLPISLCVLGPLGDIIGKFVTEGLLSFGKLGGLAFLIAIFLVGALWEWFVLTGMHLLMITTLFVVLAQSGHEDFIMIGASVASLAVAGMCLGSALRMKKNENRALAWSYLLAAILGGVTEPGLYGLAIRYKKPALGMMLGGGIGALYGGITHVQGFVVPPANFLAVTAFSGKSFNNLLNGIISCALAFVVAAITSYIVGLNENQIEN